MKKLILAALAAVMGLGTITAETFTAPVKVEGGMVRGFVKDGVDTYLGIPFAQPPVGDLRWKAPQPVQSWGGVLTCDRFAPAPMMAEKAHNYTTNPNFTVTDDVNTAMSEDCLYLNIWTPAKKPAKPMPVMVWIFGGGFHVGSTDLPVYRGDAFAKKDVVLVSIPYRLGVFGYLAHPELSRESGHGSGNYAIYDQIAGIQWVKDNIAAFGGDPDNITVFGQSAGSRSTQGIVSSKHFTEGLFQKAIPMSGMGIRDDAHNLPLAENAALGKAFFESLGATNLEQMRNIDAATLQQAYQTSQFMDKFRPAIDGYLITEDFNDSALGGRYMDIDYMIGYTKDDVPAADFPKSIGSWAENQVENLGRRPVYVYRFDHPQPEDPNKKNDKGDIWGAKGVVHGAEVIYVFGRLPISPKPMTKQDYELSERMVTYWTNFAKYGNPNGSKGGEWKPFTKDDKNTFIIDVK